MASSFDDATQLEISASPEVCYEAMTDFTSYPQWQKAVVKVNILEERPEGPVVEFITDLIVRKVRYVLAYRLEPEKCAIGWEYVEGDAKRVDGAFEATPLGDGARSMATYRLAIDPGFWVPGPVIKKIKNAVMSGVLKDLNKRVTSR